MTAMRRTLLLAWVALAAPLFASSPEFLIGGTVAAAEHAGVERTFLRFMDYVSRGRVVRR